MNKFLKFAVALALLLAVVIVAQGGAWAAKVNSADSAPVAAVDGAGVAVARPAGTVSNTIKTVMAVDGVGEIHKAGVNPVGSPAGTYYSVTSCSSAVSVKFEAGPNWSGGVFYFDGANWTRVQPYEMNGYWYADFSCAMDPFYFIIGPAGS